MTAKRVRKAGPADQVRTVNRRGCTVIAIARNADEPGGRAAETAGAIVGRPAWVRHRDFRGDHPGEDTTADILRRVQARTELPIVWIAERSCAAGTQPTISR